MNRASSILCTVALLAFWTTFAQSQQPIKTAPGLARTDGVESVSSIAYVRLFLNAETATTPEPADAFDLSKPTLTVQCTKKPNGKFAFELFVNFGGVIDASFYPPWRPASSDDHFPPPTQKVTMMMEFLGYTKIKPVRRQFEYVIAPSGQLRYNPPSGGSSNLEEIAYYFQYLKALPTLRLSGASHTATFQTAPLLAAIHKEPLCRAIAL